VRLKEGKYVAEVGLFGDGGASERGQMGGNERGGAIRSRAIAKAAGKFRWQSSGQWVKTGDKKTSEQLIGIEGGGPP